MARDMAIDPCIKITGILCYIGGIALCISIVGLIFGIPLILAANFYMKCDKMSDAELVQNKNTFLGWSIFTGIVGFPLLTILVILSYVAIGKLDGAKIFPDGTAGAGGSKPSGNSMDDKLKRIEQLAEFKAKGLIIEEEFKESKAKILAE